MRIKITLALISAIFMIWWVGFLINDITDSSSLEIIKGLLGVISFFGSVLFLLEARKILPRWHLAVPFCISLFLLVIVNLWFILRGKEVYSDNIGSIAELLWTILLAFLSPFSALVFLSLHKHPDSMKVYLVVSSVASIFSLFYLSPILLEILRWSSYEPLLIFPIFYWGVVMPIIGICFLLSALTYRKPGKILNLNSAVYRE